jgi:DNA-binding NarL/FixJ family response regulator
LSMRYNMCVPCGRDVNCGNGEKGGTSTNPYERTAAIVLDRCRLRHEELEHALACLEIRVCGRAARTDRALRMLNEFRPELLVVKLGEPPHSLTVLAGMRTALIRASELRILAIVGSDDGGQIAAAFSAGAAAVVLDTARADDIAAAIRQMFEPSIYLANANSSELEPPTLIAPTGLTPRELEILRLVAEGHSNSQLAKMLWVTEQTVKFHLSNIYRKLDVSNRTEASRWAQLHGLLPAAARTDTAAA